MSCLHILEINPLSVASFANIFLDHSLKAKEIKANINKWNLIKLKSFHTAKETINKMNRQPMEWAKIFAKDAPNKVI